MAVLIHYRDDSQWANNWQFPTLIEFALETARDMSRYSERVHITRLEEWWGEYFPGRHLDIESDFPSESDRKFWSRIFYEVARRIYKRTLGNHEHDFWQAQRISQAYRIGSIFEQAARESDPRWTAMTTDRMLFHKYHDTER